MGAGFIQWHPNQLFWILKISLIEIDTLAFYSDRFRGKLLTFSMELSKGLTQTSDFENKLRLFESTKFVCKILITIRTWKW